MGGCRCTYRNCTLRTDGKTHMFHYPVFDKVRCHQWLTNAQKLEFLNLKVSQLKNRVVCQHHFKDDNFMNFKKDKLTFDAVPTEDGPYCDSSQLENKKTEQDDCKVFSISLDDIENEYLTQIDKKANFSVKYGDFLTNCDLMDLDSLNQINDNNQVALKGLCMLDTCPTIPKQAFSSKPVKNVTLLKGEKISNNIILNDNTNKKKNKDKFIINKNKTLDICKFSDDVQQRQDNQNSMASMINVYHVPIEFDKMKHNDQIQQNIDQPNDNMVIYEPTPVNESKIFHGNANRSHSKDNKITIISEKKICEPVPLIGKLEPVSPNKVITLPNKKRKNITNLVQEVPTITIDVHNSVEEASTEQTSMIQDRIVIKNNECEPRKIYSSNKNIASSQNSSNNVYSNEVLPNTSFIKNKIPPERVAAIAEKRKFNMKLRDIIEDCLDKLDEPDKSDFDMRNTKMLHKSRLMQSKQQPVFTYLAKEQQLPSVQHYTIAYLEARMKKMENNLLSKIEENSKKVGLLKQTFSQLRTVQKSVHTQTAFGEDAHKKHLYQELSKYLSQEANNLVYEELFINKYTKEIPKVSPSAKRRKRR